MSREVAVTGVDPSQSGSTASPFAEHSLVRLRRAATLDDGSALPAGSVGAVVGVWGDGAAYLVEFAEPVEAIATVAAPNLTRAEIAEA